MSSWKCVEGMGVTQNPCRGPMVWRVCPCGLTTGDGETFMGRFMNKWWGAGGMFVSVPSRAGVRLMQP